MTTATVGKWGNAAAIRLPQPFCEQLDIRPGDRVTVSLDANKCIRIQPSSAQHTLQARLAHWDGGRFESEECDWGAAAGKEMW